MPFGWTYSNNWNWNLKSSPAGRPYRFGTMHQFHGVIPHKSAPGEQIRRKALYHHVFHPFMEGETPYARDTPTRHNITFTTFLMRHFSGNRDGASAQLCFTLHCVFACTGRVFPVEEEGVVQRACHHHSFIAPLLLLSLSLSHPASTTDQ